MPKFKKYQQQIPSEVQVDLAEELIIFNTNNRIN